MLLLRPLLPPAWYRHPRRLLFPCPRCLSRCLTPAWSVPLCPLLPWLQHPLRCRLRPLLFLLLVGLNLGGRLEPAMLRIIRMTCPLCILLLSRLRMTSFWFLYGVTSPLRSSSLPCDSPHLNSLFRLPLLVLRRLLSIALATLRVVVSAVTVSALMLLPLCALMSSRMLIRPCWPLICVMSVLTGSTLLM